MSFLGMIWRLLEFMKLTIKSSICFKIFVCGRGMIAARWVNFDKREVFTMLALPKMVVWILDQAKLSFLASLSAFVQLWSRLVREGLRLMPRSLK